jgi:putative toxin-antitoxin system antitoxin component (TIGR02293 family)
MPPDMRRPCYDGQMTERTASNVPPEQAAAAAETVRPTAFIAWHGFLSELKDYESGFEAGAAWHKELDRQLTIHFEGRLENALFCLSRVPAVVESTAIEHGLQATSTWGSLEELGFTKLEIAHVVDTSEKTIQRKEKKAERLGVAEGDRTMRLLRIVAEAVDAIGDREKALRWLRKPNRALGGKKPLEAIATERGVAMVRQSLAAIAYGGVA